MTYDEQVALAGAYARHAMGLNLDPADVWPEIADLCGLDEGEVEEIVMAVLRSQQEREIADTHDALLYGAAVEHHYGGA